MNELASCVGREISSPAQSTVDAQRVTVDVSFPTGKGVAFRSYSKVFRK